MIDIIDILVILFGYDLYVALHENELPFLLAKARFGRGKAQVGRS